jgi:hypothetical protein
VVAGGGGGGGGRTVEWFPHACKNVVTYFCGDGGWLEFVPLAVAACYKSREEIISENGLFKRENGGSCPILQL